MNFSYPLICLHDIFFRLPNHELFSWISTLPLNAGTKPFRITESPAHRTPKPTNTDQQTIIITKKRKLKVFPQHATLTPPSATSTPEPNVQRKKPRYSDNSPLQYTSTSNSSTLSTHCITSLFGPNPNINIQPPVPEEPFNPNIDTPDSVYISYYCAWLYSYKMYIENCFMYTRK